MYRSHTCGELRINDITKTATLSGWVQTVRKFGSITFVDLRDRYGITQLLFSENLNAQLDANPLGREFVLQVKGTVNERSNKNANMPTGDIEIGVTEFTIPVDHFKAVINAARGQGCRVGVNKLVIYFLSAVSCSFYRTNFFKFICILAALYSKITGVCFIGCCPFQ